VSEAKIPLTEARKDKIKSFAFDEEGNKEFASYLNELKEIASTAVKDKDDEGKDKPGASKETASIGSILNTNSVNNESKDTKLAALFC
jgi:hypothetical protein